MSDITLDGRQEVNCSLKKRKKKKKETMPTFSAVYGFVDQSRQKL